MLKRKDMSPQDQAKRMRYENIARPAKPFLNPENDKIIFQHLELDHYVGSACPNISEPQAELVPIMRMFGVSKSGNSICCHVHGFFPYFHVSLPDSFTAEELVPFREKLNDAILSYTGMANETEIPTDAVLRLELVKGKPPTGGDDTNFAKITLTLPKFIPAARHLLTSTTVYQPLQHHNFSCYEADVDIVTRFMADTNILGCCWIELPAGKWFIKSCISRCQLEVDIYWEHFVAHAPENEWASVAPFRIHSFDIECIVRGNTFPQYHTDAVIQIANVVKLHGTENDIITRNIFTLKSCAPIENAVIFSFETEALMLEAWAEFVIQVDPDIFTGYNIHNFDFPYLLNRAKHLKLENFNFLGRLLNVRSEIRREVVTQKARNRSFTYKCINFEGRVPYDMLLVARRDFNSSACDLNTVCQHILGERKEDVHYSMVTSLQNGDDETRRRLAIYCLKDAELPLKLLSKTPSFMNDIEKSRVAGMPIVRLWSNEERINVCAQLLRYAKRAGYFMPTHCSDQYEGAPIKVNTNSTETLDFNYLYKKYMVKSNLDANVK